MKKHFLLALFFLLTIAIQAQKPGFFSIAQDSILIEVSARPVEGGSTTGEGYYHEGDLCTITAIPNPGYHFVNWTEKPVLGGEETAVSDSTSYSFTVRNWNRTFYANFEPIPEYTITVRINPDNSGIVNGGGTYFAGDFCTLTAHAEPRFTFINWTVHELSVCDSTTYSFLVNNDMTVFANFKRVYHIGVVADPENGGNVSGEGDYSEGSYCTVTATANPGFKFSRWTCNNEQVSLDSTYSFQVAEDRNLVAKFIKVCHIETEVEPSDGGTVTGAGEYDAGETVTLTATPNDYYTFSHWNDGETVNPREILVQEDATYIAYFSPLVPIINEDITVPATICSGESLELNAPSTTNAEETAWQIAENADFESPIIYEGQPLNGSYNGWKLRFTATNQLGTVFSNVVDINIQVIELSLTGDTQVCSNTEAGYAVQANGNYAYRWSVSDPEAIVKGDGPAINVLWSTHAGRKQLSVVAQDLNTGCSDSLTMTVNVESHVAIHDSIVCKEKDGLPYLLLYANSDTLEYQYQWYCNDSVIPCTKQYYYVPSSAGGIPPGKYKVYVSRSEDAAGNLYCGEFSPEFEIAASDGTRVTFYPNPCHTNGRLVIVNEDWGEVDMDIYSTDGRLMHHQTLHGRQNEITVTLPQGIYLLRLANRNGVKTEKIVIQNP